MDETRSRRQTSLICLGLAAAILAAYAPLWRCQFISYDDPDYVTANEMVRQGVSRAGVVWAFTTTSASNWHPLTWISHEVDVQLYGMNPAGHHATSLLLHLANSILLFLLLQRMTKARWPSALAAALFGLHPLHVESVAWVAERKDVLSTLFWMLTVRAYVRYVEEFKIQDSKYKIQYALALFFFALGLMAKQMLVTLPFILILLDYWPLQRLGAPLGRLAAEKAPFFILAGAACVVAYLVQQHSGAVVPADRMPVGLRLANAPVSYVRYVAKTFWPADLAVFYPYPGHWPGWKVALSAAFLAAVTGWVVSRIRTQGYLAVGWLWFLGMLVPVIGLVQIGPQSMADRYDYLPGVGLFIMIAWGAREWVWRLGGNMPAVLAARSKNIPARRSRGNGTMNSFGKGLNFSSPPHAGAWLINGLSALAVAGCMGLTAVQTGYWKNSETVCRRALETTGGNSVMESAFGNVLLQEGRVDEALPWLEQAAAANPNYPIAHRALGQAFLAKGRVEEALEQFAMHVNLQPDDPFAQAKLGTVLLEHGRAGEALPHLEKAAELFPLLAQARHKLYAMGMALDTEFPPLIADAHCQLGTALLQLGRTGEAIRQYEESLAVVPDYIPAFNNLVWLLAAEPDASLRNGARALELGLRANELSGGRDPRILGGLAIAYAEAGKFDAAAATVQKALHLTGGTGNAALEPLLRSQLALYQAGRPFRDPGLAAPASVPRGR